MARVWHGTVGGQGRHFRLSWTSFHILRKTGLILCDLQLSHEKNNSFQGSYVDRREQILSAQHNTYLDRNLEDVPRIPREGCLEGHLNLLYPNHGAQFFNSLLIVPSPKCEAVSEGKLIEIEHLSSRDLQGHSCFMLKKCEHLGCT